MTTFTAADGAAAAERLAAQQQAIVESLINLEDHLGRKFLDSTVLAGVTRLRRADLLDGFARLWCCYESYRSSVERVRTIMARSRPAPAELREVEALVTGAATVVLRNPEASLLDRQVTLDELVAEIKAEYGRVHDLVTAVDRVWAELTPRIDGCDTWLRQARTLAADLGLAADQDPAAGVLTELAGRLDELRRIALTDPLRLWADGAVACAEADQLVAGCEQAHADLQSLAELRRNAGQRLDQVDSTLHEVSGLHREIAEEHRRVDVKILSAPERTAGPQSSNPLRSRLTAAMEIHRRGRWRRLATELPALERDVSAALRGAKGELIEAGRPLRERAELRGRLGAYRAKAAGLGRIEDLALEQLYQRARALLWHAPCDLAVAAAAVAEYQDAVNGSGMNGAPA